MKTKLFYFGLFGIGLGSLVLLNNTNDIVLKKDKQNSEPKYNDTDVNIDIDYDELIIGEDRNNLPILIVFHGLGSNKSGMINFFNDFMIPVRIIFPNGIEQYKNSKTGRQWWELRSKTENQDLLADQIIDSVNKFIDFIEEIKIKYPNSPVYLAGHSQGGMMALALSVLYPECFDGVSIASVWLPEKIQNKFNNDFKIETFIVHGTKDGTVSFNRTDEWLESINDKDLTYIEASDMGHGLKDDLLYEWIDGIYGIMT